MNEIRVIKSEKDYEEALMLAEVLVSRDPDPESEDGEKLGILSALIEDYESKFFPQNLPSPVEAIKFRMDQMDLKPADLVPYLGTRSRVSEILSGKRQLTLEMIRALETGLGIPAKVLIKKQEASIESPYAGWDTRLLREMEKRHYFGDASIKNTDAQELLSGFFSITGFQQQQLVGMLRQTSFRASPLTDKNALAVWSECILKKAEKINPKVKYQEGVVNLEFMQELAKLSIKENGPIVAQKHLRDNGIILVIEPHFSKTYLDGATLLTNRDNPVIGLTLRHDRLDNFWFTLMHELAHISLHWNEDTCIFYDEIEGVKGINISEKEKEADQLAEEALLPEGKWEVSPARLVPSPMAANSLAKEVGVHVAIIAGQIRHRGNKYVYLNKIVNEAKVRSYFPAEQWLK